MNDRNIRMANPGANDERSIGDIIRNSKNLNVEQVEKILQYQRSNGIRFGEAAVALGYVKPDEVLWALSQQFQYAYSGGDMAKVSDELVVAHSPFSNEAERFRDMRSQIMSMCQGQAVEPKAVAVLSANIGDGKTFFAANTAISYSQLGAKTLLIDADLRYPRMHELFGVASANGLSNMLAGRGPATVVRPLEGLPNLYLLPAGIIPPNPLELIQRDAFDKIIVELLAKFTHVIVDTPAAAHGADAVVIAEKCGRAVLVGRKDHTAVAHIQGFAARLNRSLTQVLGVVYNDF